MIIDSSGNNHIITRHGDKRLRSLMSGRMFMGASGVGGDDETAYSFDGSGDYLEMPYSSDWDIYASASQDYTVDFWVKHTDHAGFETYTAQEGTGASQYWYIFHVHGSGIAFQVYDGVEIMDTRDAGGYGGEITDTDWHHIALCKVTSAGPTVEWGIYLDGSQITYMSDATTGTLTNGVLRVADIDVGGWGEFDGNIDEVRMTNTNSFSAAPNVGETDTITVPTTRHVSNSNTKLLIHGNEAYTGALTGEATQSCYAFDGDYLTVPDSSDWAFGSGDFTLEARIKLNSLTNQPIFGQGTYVSGNGQELVVRSDGDLQYYDYNGGYVLNVDCPAGITTGEWYHVVITRTSGVMYFFVNGVEKTISLLNGAQDATLTDVPAVFEIGSSALNARVMDGEIAEVRVSNVGRWTTGFTPETERYTSDSNTKLLIHGDEGVTGTTGSGATFTDSGDTGHTVTENANAIQANGGTFTDSGGTGHTVTENGNAVRNTGTYKF